MKTHVKLETDTAPAPCESQRAWNGPPRVLDTMLALCDPPGWDLSPAQRQGRRSAAANALRLFELLEQMRHRNPIDQLHVTGNAAAWKWDTFRFGHDSADFEVTMAFDSGLLKFNLAVVNCPSLVRKFSLHHETRDRGIEFDQHWILTPRAVPMAYPQARAFIAALALSCQATSVRLGTELVPKTSD